MYVEALAPNELSQLQCPPAPSAAGPIPKCADEQVVDVRKPHWNVGFSGCDVDSAFVLYTPVISSHASNVQSELP